jgi:hypothetical protein
MMPPTSKMPPVENHQNHAQKSYIGDIGGIGGILYSSSGETYQNVDFIKESMFNCHYCKGFQTNNEKEYQRHVVLRHPGETTYPSEINLEKEGLN